MRDTNYDMRHGELKQEQREQHVFGRELNKKYYCQNVP